MRLAGGTSGGKGEWWLGETSWRYLWKEEGMVARWELAELPMEGEGSGG